VSGRLRVGFVAALATLAATLLAGCGGGDGERSQVAAKTEHAQTERSHGGHSHDEEGATLYHLYLLPVGGGRPRAVPDPREEPYLTLDPAWSPDGRRLAVTEVDCHACPPEIRVIDLDDPSGRRTVVGHGSRPSFSADGRSIVFISPSGDLTVVDMSGGSRQVLVPAHRGGLDQPAFSPNGRNLAYIRQDTTGQWRLFAAAADGRDPRALVRGGGSVVDPTWARDGARIAFARQGADGKWQVYLMSPTGRRPRRITQPPGSSSAPSLTPDGRTIVYVRQQGSTFELMRRRLVGGSAERLDIGRLSDPVQPAVSPDGKLVAFSARALGD